MERLLDFLHSISVATADKEVRDRHGRLLYREHQEGNRIVDQDIHEGILETKSKIGNEVNVSVT